MKEQQTCGKGLAENSVLPAKLGELTGAVAEILEAHREALDRTDEKSRAELAGLLQTRIEADRKMLQAMSGPG